MQEKLKEITKEASVFYSMMSLFKVACNYGDFIVGSAKVGDRIRKELGYVTAKFRLFERKISAEAPVEVRAQWDKEWTDRDYEIFASVFFKLADMNEQQRAVVEEFCAQVEQGKAHAVKIEGGPENSDALPPYDFSM